MEMGLMSKVRSTSASASQGKQKMRGVVLEEMRSSSQLEVQGSEIRCLQSWEKCFVVLSWKVKGKKISFCGRYRLLEER
jgi:hypothetical protein